MSQCGKNNPSNYRLPRDGNSWFCGFSARSYEKPHVTEGAACHCQPHCLPTQRLLNIPLDFKSVPLSLPSVSSVSLCTDPLVYGHVSAYSHICLKWVFSAWTSTYMQLCIALKQGCRLERWLIGYKHVLLMQGIRAQFWTLV